MTTTTATPPASTPAAAAASPAAAPASEAPAPSGISVVSSDVLRRGGPALSATSDMPVLSPAPAPEASAPPASTPAAAAPADGKPGEGGEAATAADDGTTGTEGKDTTPAWMKAEITKERNRRRAAEDRAERAEAERAAAAARLDETLRERAAATPPPPEAPRPTRPTRAQFETPEAYDEALVAHEEALIEWTTKRAATDVTKAAEEARKAEEAKAQETAKAEEARKAAETAAATWSQREAEATAKYPDYEAVAKNPDVKISEPMAAKIVTVANGADVAYHLGKNPQEAARIAALPPIEAMVEIGILSRELARPKPAEITSAPDPVRTVGARASAVSKTAEEESMDEYARRRTEQLRASARAH